MTALCGITAQGLISWPFLVGALFAPTQGSHFQAFHPLRFLFICTLHWCKYCTVLAVTTNVRKFPMTSLCEIAAHGHICRPVLVGALLAPTHSLHFQSLHPFYFAFHLLLAFVQTLYHARDSREYALISNFGARKNCRQGTNLQTLPSRYAFCTDLRFTFSGSPSP